MAKKMIDSGMTIYVGIPPTGAENGTFFSSVPSQKTSSSTPCHGVLAFFVGTVLSCCAWIANQGWTVAALLLFGEFSWALSAWKHILLMIVGSVSTTLAFSTVFGVIFSEDNDDENGGLSSCKKDVSDALRDLGELGMITGYIGSMLICNTLIDKKLVAIGIVLEQSNEAFNMTTMVFMVLWVLYTKMRDYNKAVNRANSLQRKDVYACVSNCVESAEECYDKLIREC